MKIILLLVVIVGISEASVRKNQLNRVCYYVKNPNLTADLIDPTLCSHIIFGFATVNYTTILPEEPTDPKLYQEFFNLKKKAPDLKILIGITGSKFTFADTPRDRSLFVNSSLAFIKKYGFDGLDFDWEFPGWNGPIQDRIGFLQLLQELYNRKTELYPKDKAPLITAAVSASLTIIDWSYDVAVMSNFVDFISIMCYDYNFYRKYLPFTGHNSPLFHHKGDVIFFNTWNIEWSANFWAKKGMPKEKIMVGLPTYGHTFKLLNPDKAGVYDLVQGPGSGDGWITYTEVCSVIENGGVHTFDNQSLVPYVHNGYNWISYDDPTSMKFKAKWIAQENFGGVMTWNLNSDDWAGNCTGVKFPLHKVLRDNLIQNQRNAHS